MVLILLLACADPALVELGAGGGDLGLSLTADFADAEVAAYSDLTLDWSGVTSDWLCNPLSTSITRVTLCSLPRLDHAEVEDAIVDEALSQIEMEVCGTQTVTATSTTLSDLMSGFDPTVHLSPTPGSWLLTTATDTSFVGVQFVSPSEDSTYDTLVVSDPCGSLDLDVAMSEGGGTTTSLPDSDHVVLDWSAVTTDSYGRSVEPSDLVNVTVGHFTTAELGIGLLRDDLGADEAWSLATTTPPTADLSMLAGGPAFTGFTSGTWAITLRTLDDTDLLPGWIQVFVVP
jgi:hypothetical protein